MTNEKDIWERVTWDEYPPSVNWNETNEVVGKILMYKTVTLSNRDADCIILDCGKEGKRTIWRSAGLQALFDLPVGSFVKVRCLGMRKSPTTKRLFRSFEIFVRSSSTVGPF